VSKCSSGQVKAKAVDGRWLFEPQIKADKAAIDSSLCLNVGIDEYAFPRRSVGTRKAVDG